MPKFTYKSEMPVSAQMAFGWLAHPDAFFRLTPPWESVRLVSKTGGIRTGDRLVFDLQPAPGVRVRWVAEHQGYVAGEQFQDVQRQGPFAHWIHTHRVIPIGGDSRSGSCVMSDHIDYRLPMAWLTGWLGNPVTERRLQRMFAYRHTRMHLDLALAQLSAHHPKRQIALVGLPRRLHQSLGCSLRMGGHTVVLAPPSGRGLEKSAIDIALVWRGGPPSHLHAQHRLVLVNPPDAVNTPRPDITLYLEQDDLSLQRLLPFSVEIRQTLGSTVPLTRLTTLLWLALFSETENGGRLAALDYQDHPWIAACNGVISSS